MKVLNRILYWCYQIVQVIGAVVLAAIMLIVTAGIISRYFFNSPFSWTEEVTTFLMVYLCYISAALTTIQKKHIVADFFITKAPPQISAGCLRIQPCFDDRVFCCGLYQHSSIAAPAYMEERG